MITLILLLIILIIIAIPLCILTVIGMISWKLLAFLLACALLDYLMIRLIFFRKKA